MFIQLQTNDECCCCCWCCCRSCRHVSVEVCPLLSCTYAPSLWLQVLLRFLRFLPIRRIAPRSGGSNPKHPKDGASRSLDRKLFRLRLPSKCRSPSKCHPILSMSVRLRPTILKQKSRRHPVPFRTNRLHQPIILFLIRAFCLHKARRTFRRPFPRRRLPLLPKGERWFESLRSHRSLRSLPWISQTSTSGRCRVASFRLRVLPPPLPGRSQPVRCFRLG